MAEKIAHTNNLSFPLEGFLSHLRGEGFNVTPQQYHELNVLLNTIAVEYKFEELGSLLSPLFVNNREEQSAFYEIFEQYFSKVTTENKPDKSIKSTSVQTKKTKGVSSQKSRNYDDDNDIVLRLLGVALALILYLLLIFWVFEAAFSFFPSSISQIYQNNPPSFVIITHVCVAILVFLFYQVRKIYRKNNKKKSKVTRNEKEFTKSPPFTFRPKINLPNLNLLPKNEALQLNRALVSQADDYINTGIPDIYKTLKKTVENAGLVEIQYQRYRSKPRYLLLIDTAQSNKHQAEWFDYIAYILQDSDTTVEKYFFDQDPRYVRAKKGDKEIPLSNVYNSQRILVLADGSEFMDTITGELYNWVMDLFNIWDERAVLTDRPIEDWDATEKLLDAEFEIAPATIEGLLNIIDDFDNRKDNRLEDWQKNDALDYLATNEVSILKSTLPQNVFLWLCSCAVFPRLYWDLTLYLGLDAEKQTNELLNPKYLSLFNRLRWIRQGKIPAEKRAELIGYLPAERLLSTRRAIAKVLQNKASIPPYDSYAFEEYQVFLLRNEYELEENTPVKKAIYLELDKLVEETGEDSAEILEFLEKEKTILDIEGDSVSSRKNGVFAMLKRGIQRKVSPTKNGDELTWISYRNSESTIRIKSGVKEKVADSQRIILLIHGLMSGTELMAPAFRKQIESEKYDTVLAFDYESAVTSLSESALVLQQKLAEVGISKDSKKRVTIVAENSGAIVARWLIEQLEGKAFTEQLILIGPANGGLKFADFYKRFGNIISFFPFVSKAAFNLVPVMKQLPTDAEIIKTLNRSADPHVPYKIMHGSIEAMNFANKKVSRWTRFVANFIIKEDSDGAVGVSSAKSVGNGERPVADEEAINSKVGAEGIFGDRRPIPHYHQVECIVGEYFTAEASLFRLNAFLNEEQVIVEDEKQEESFSVEDVPNILEDEGTNSNINVQQSMESEPLELENLGVEPEPISLLDQIYRHNIIGTQKAKEDMLKDLVDYLKNTKEKEELTELDFSGLKLAGLTINTPQLTNCSFIDVEMSKMLIIRAEMDRVNWGRANINNSDFIQLKSSASDYSNANLFKNLMNKAIEVRPKFFETSILDCDYYYSEFELAEFTGTKIKGCNFNFTRFESCKFTDCEIVNSEFNEANFSLTEFDNCRLSDLQLKDAQFRDVVFRNMDLRRFDFETVRFISVQIVDCEVNRGDIARFNRKELEVITTENENPH